MGQTSEFAASSLIVRQAAMFLGFELLSNRKWDKTVIPLTLMSK